MMIYPFPFDYAIARSVLTFSSFSKGKQHGDKRLPTLVYTDTKTLEFQGLKSERVCFKFTSRVDWPNCRMFEDVEDVGGMIKKHLRVQTNSN